MNPRLAWLDVLRKQLLLMRKRGNAEAELALLKVLRAYMDERHKEEQ